jgi:hypothetical protein
MRRRLYFVLPDVESARRMFDEMLLARIEERHIRFLTRRDGLPPDLPEAGVLQKTDLAHGATIGLVVGGVLGVAAGLFFVAFPPSGELKLVTVLVTAFIGALFGVWVASMVGTAVPNSRLRHFAEDMERGAVLMIVDVPALRVREITERVATRHPEILGSSLEPIHPAFP